MRFSFLIFFVLFFEALVPAFAQEAIDLKKFEKAELIFNGGKKAQCQLFEATRVYKCLHEKTTILIELEDYASGIAIDADSNITHLEIEKLNSQGASLYQAAVIPELPDFLLTKASPKEMPDETNNSLAKKIQNRTVLEDFLSGFSSNIDEFSPLYQVVNYLSDIHAQISEEIDKLSMSKDYIVELNDGSSKSCHRLESQKSICSIFSCEDLNKEGQKNGVSSLLLYSSSYDEEIYPTIQNFKNEELIPSPIVTKIINPIDKKVIASFNDESIIHTSDEMRPYLDKTLVKDVDNILFLKNEFAKDFYDKQKLNCAPSGTLKNYHNARENLKNKLAYTSLAELIYILEDGTLLSDFYGHEIAKSQGCYYGGVYFEKNAAQNLEKIATTFPKEVLPDQTISMDKVNELFKSATEMKDIAWNYKYDGCYARAHIMARRFEAQGIRVDKAWLKGDLYVPGSDITWNYHVAPLLYVKDDKGKIQKMVIDPSLFDRPVTLEEWDQRIAKKTVRGSVKTVFPFPQNADFYERSALAISSSDPYTPGENIDNTEEYKMQHAKDTMVEYLSDLGQNPY